MSWEDELAKVRDYNYFGLNRTLCDVLEDMRKCAETTNFGPLRALIEEAQIMGNRMEAGLHGVKDLNRLQEEISKLKKIKKEMLKELEAKKA